MDLQKLSLNSVHENGEDEFIVEERMDSKGEIYIKLKLLEKLIKE